MVSIEKKSIFVAYRPDGTRISIPFIRIGQGRKRLFIAAVVHGDEVTGLVSIWRFMEYLRDREVHGEIGIVPVVNIEGFNYDVRGIPLETVDLNRVYPGDPRGYLAERVAATVWSLAREYEFIVDMHTAGISIPFILVDPAPPDLKKMIVEVAVKSGITVLEEYVEMKYELRRLAASLPGVAIGEGIPSFTVELPSLYRPSEPGIDVGLKVLKNIAIALGIVEDSFENIDEYPVIRELGYRREDVAAEKGGFIEYHADLGQYLEAGTVLARIRDLFGDVVEEVRMPHSGYTIAFNPSFRSWSGSIVALIAVRK